MWTSYFIYPLVYGQTFRLYPVVVVVFTITTDSEVGADGSMAVLIFDIRSCQAALQSWPPDLCYRESRLNVLVSLCPCQQSILSAF